MVVTFGTTVRLSRAATIPISPFKEMRSAFTTVHFRITDCPGCTAMGSAVKLRIFADGPIGKPSRGSRPGACCAADDEISATDKLAAIRNLFMNHNSLLAQLNQ